MKTVLKLIVLFVLFSCQKNDDNSVVSDILVQKVEIKNGYLKSGTKGEPETVTVLKREEVMINY